MKKNKISKKIDKIMKKNIKHETKIQQNKKKQQNNINQ